jgi:hypothetical protein
LCGPARCACPWRQLHAEGADKKRKAGFKMTMPQFVHYMAHQVSACWRLAAKLVTASAPAVAVALVAARCCRFRVTASRCHPILLLFLCPQSDESPLYVFERKFAEIAPVLREQYDPASLKVRAPEWPCALRVSCRGTETPSLPAWAFHAHVLLSHGLPVGTTVHLKAPGVPPPR